MRTTLDLPNELIDEAMQITHAKTKTDLIKLALTNIIQQEKINKLINFHGSIDLDIDLDAL
ncbi:MAG: type II toxin-antitoxin system VapB family antitoxin, partial [Spirochaetales bacterium]|nr:type II toxin-antitoxin system VapB family antitoxin [Spirochaetales bacterium]